MGSMLAIAARTARNDNHKARRRRCSLVFATEARCCAPRSDLPTFPPLFSPPTQARARFLGNIMGSVLVIAARAALYDNVYGTALACLDVVGVCVYLYDFSPVYCQMFFITASTFTSMAIRVSSQPRIMDAGAYVCRTFFPQLLLRSRPVYTQAGLRTPARAQ